MHRRPAALPALIILATIALAACAAPPLAREGSLREPLPTRITARPTRTPYPTATTTPSRTAEPTRTPTSTPSALPTFRAPIRPPTESDNLQA